VSVRVREGMAVKVGVTVGGEVCCTIEQQYGYSAAMNTAIDKNRQIDTAAAGI